MKGKSKRGRHRQHIRYGISNRSKGGTGTVASRRMRYNIAPRIRKSGKAKRYVNKYKR